MANATSKTKVDVKGRMKVLNTGYGGANPTGSIANTEGYDSFQQARGQSKGSTASGKSSGAASRMHVNGGFGGAKVGGSIVSTQGNEGKECGRTTTQMGETGAYPKGEYADRMQVAGGFGGKKVNKTIGNG